MKFYGWSSSVGSLWMNFYGWMSQLMNFYGWTSVNERILLDPFGWTSKEEVFGWTSIKEVFGWTSIGEVFGWTSIDERLRKRSSSNKLLWIFDLCGWTSRNLLRLWLNVFLMELYEWSLWINVYGWISLGSTMDKRLWMNKSRIYYG